MINDSISTKKHFATVIETMAKSTFFEATIAYLSGLFEGLNGIVIRYHKTACPEILFNQVLDSRIIAIYLNGLYVLDPLNKIAQAEFSTGVYSFSESFEVSNDRTKYQQEVLKGALISDELAWLIKLPDSSTLAFCLDKPCDQFSKEEILKARLELPVIKSLSEKHFELEFLGKLKKRKESHAHIERIMHIPDGGITESAQWQVEFSSLPNIDKAVIEQETLLANGLEHYREFILSNGAILSFCKIDLDDEQYLLQRIRPRNVLSNEKYRNLIDGAIAHGTLSLREQDVIFLSMLGYPNSLIAKKLSISNGTVKNHKYSIYNKLDITSERELFNQILRNIVGAEKIGFIE